MNSTQIESANRVRIGLAQLNLTVGDIDANIARIVTAAKDAADQGCTVVIYPEMAVTGYPLEDLVLSTALQTAAESAVQDLASRLDARGLGELTLVVGTLGVDSVSPTNEAVVIRRGEVQYRYNKRHLPTYGVFDEGRVFTAGTDPLTVTLSDGTRMAIVVCEDLWRADEEELNEVTKDAHVLVSLNASPFEIGKVAVRTELLERTVEATNIAVAYVNSVGTQDELIFDGKSMLVSANGEVLQGPGFTEAVLVADLDPSTGEFTAVSQELVAVDPLTTRSAVAAQHTELEDIYLALVQSVRDFTTKCGLTSVALGLSGGIDSALVAAIAVDALGAENVYGLAMPSQYSSAHSVNDAVDLAQRTGLSLRTVPITPLLETYVAATTAGGIELTGLAKENLQARIRGVLLMALSNSVGPMILATGNKSELAVGYSTIYGDAVGGYAPLKDVYKTVVWDLARWRNAQASGFDNSTPPIPDGSIEKPPSAELRPDQLDSDSLPDYSVLDGILNLYIDQRAQISDIVTRGYDEALVREIVGKTNLAEYKRRQYPPGPKVTGIAFGRDRRMPISNRFT